MYRRAPLPDYPELTIIRGRAWCEYRVDSPRLWPSGLLATWKLYWVDAFACLVMALVWPYVERASMVVLAVMTLWYVYSRCNQVLWESVIVLQSLGIQLETHKGLPPIALFSSRRFIPLNTLQDFVLNEGLHGWTIQHYLAAVQTSPSGEITLEVPFENIMPRFPVLLEVYHGVHEILNSTPDNIPPHSNE